MKTKISLALAGTIALLTAYSCNGLKEVPDNDIKVESIEFDKTEIYSFVGEELRIEAKINPYNATERKIEWSSSDDDIVSVDSTGRIRLHNEGDVTIFATCGSAYATCDVTSVLVRVGQYYGSDGRFSDTFDPEKSIAMVFYTRHHPNDLSDYSGTGIGKEKCHGYAVALKDAVDSWCQWGPYDILGCYPKDENGNPTDNFTGNTSDTDWSGYLYTKIIEEAAQQDEGLWTGEKLEGYAACWFAVNYEKTVQAPPTSSGWFLPAGSQIWEVFENVDLLDRVEEHRFVTDDWYWSSSEYWNIPEEGANFLNTQTKRIEGLDKSGGNLVRSILAY